MTTWRFISGTNQTNFTDHLAHVGVDYEAKGDTVTVENAPPDIAALAEYFQGDEEPEVEDRYTDYSTSSGLQDAAFQDTAAAGGLRAHRQWPGTLLDQTVGQVASTKDKTIADGQNLGAPAADRLLGLLPHGPKKIARRRTRSQP